MSILTHMLAFSLGGALGMLVIAWAYRGKDE